MIKRKNVEETKVMGINWFCDNLKGIAIVLNSIMWITVIIIASIITSYGIWGILYYTLLWVLCTLSICLPVKGESNV